MSLPALTALIYTPEDHVAEHLSSIATSAQKEGKIVRGLLEERSGAEEKHRCDMILRLIGSDHQVKISQDRGTHAKGCRLDMGELTRAADLLMQTLSNAPSDLLIINKFGKSECEGTGLRHLVIHALEQKIPVIIAVPKGNLTAWRAFAGDLSVELDLAAFGGTNAWFFLNDEARAVMAA